jgi:transposase
MLITVAEISHAWGSLAIKRTIGPLTATAFVDSIADVNCFRNDKELTASLGLVPRQHLSRGRHRLLGISKRGDTYLRTLLIHDACSVVSIAKNKVIRLISGQMKC